MGRKSPKLDVAVSVLLNVPESHHGGDVIVHRRSVLPQSYCSGVVLVPLLLLRSRPCSACLSWMARWVLSVRLKKAPASW